MASRPKRRTFIRTEDRVHLSEPDLRELFDRRSHEPVVYIANAAWKDEWRTRGGRLRVRSAGPHARPLSGAEVFLTPDEFVEALIEHHLAPYRVRGFDEEYVRIGRLPGWPDRLRPAETDHHSVHVREPIRARR